MAQNDDNPPYLTIDNLHGVWHINLMEYSIRDDSYYVAISKQVHGGSRVVEEVAKEWAERDGLEIR